MPEELLKKEILKKYRSVRAFCIENSIPYSSVDNIFSRGIMGCGVGLIIKICAALDIDIEALINGEIKERRIDDLKPREKNIVKSYREQPEMQPAVDRILNIPEEKTEQ